MKCDSKYMLLYAVTNRAWTGNITLYEQVEEALKGGVTCVQIREKEMDEDTFLEEAIKLHSLCKRYNVPFVVNDNVSVAIKCQAEGVHVGQNDMATKDVRKQIGDNMILGVSVQTVEQAIIAEKIGADYLGVGAVFPTDTKLDADYVSLDTLRDISNAVELPIVAIGGISKDNLIELKGTNIDGVALVSAIFAADDIESECKELLALSKEMVRI